MWHERTVGDPAQGDAPASHTLDLVDPVGAADIPPLCRRAECLLSGDYAAVIVCDLKGVTSPDVATVDALARLQLTARRHAGGIRLVNVSPALEDLLRFSGLGSLFDEEPAP